MGSKLLAVRFGPERKSDCLPRLKALWREKEWKLRVKRSLWNGVVVDGEDNHLILLRLWLPMEWSSSWVP